MNREWEPLFFFVSWKPVYLQCLWNFTTTSLSNAEVLLFYKEMVENCRLQHCQLPLAYWRDVNHLIERITGVMRLGSQHLCGSESVAYSSPSLRAWWWRALWTSVATATAAVTDIYRLNWYQRCSCICITLPVESASFFIPSTSLCSLFSWFTSSCAYHLITVTTFTLTIYHSLGLSLQT